MNVRLQPLTEDELSLLLALLRMRFHGDPIETGGKKKLGPVPIEPIHRLARTFEKYCRKNKNLYVLADSVEWVRNPQCTHAAEAVDRQAGVDRLTHDQWRRIHEELRRILQESREVKYWAFRLPLMLPSKKVFVLRPDDLILHWLVARLIANGQQFRFVPCCRRCGRAGLRARGRKQNVYCSDECKNKAIVEQRRKERAARQAEEMRDEKGIPLDSFRTVGVPSHRRARMA